MELGSNRRMITFEPIDDTPAPIEPAVVVPTEAFDEIAAHLDEPDEAPVLELATLARRA